MSKRHRVLIVEDSDDDFNITLRALKKSGAEVEVSRCEDGDLALDYLFHKGIYQNQDIAPRPDIVLLDLNLPGTDGKEVLSALKQDETLRDIPVIVMTTSSDPRDIERCYKYGANSYVQKPVGFNNYVEAVNRLQSFWLGTALTPKGEQYSD